MPYTPVPPPFADELTPGWARFVNTIPGVTNDSEKELINFNLPQGETLITIPFAATKASSDLVLVGPVFVNVVDNAVISDITFSVVNFSTSAMTIVLSSAVDTDNYYLKTIVFVVGAFPSTNSSQSGLSGSGGGIATSINFGSILNLPTTLGGYGITDAEMSLGDPSVDGYVLSSTTGGTRSWISPSSFSLPSQVDQAGKFLQSNGTDTAWIDALDLHSAQTMTNKVIDGAANTLQNIPRTALEGYATSTLSLTDPNADSVPYWNDTAGEFQWTPVAGIAAPASIAAFMGTSTVRGISKDVFIAVRTDGKDGTGTAEDPYDGSTKAKFEAILTSSVKAPTGTTIHLGQGTFQVSEHDTVVTNAKSGWTILGSGMYSTTIQLVQDMSAITYKVAAITGTVDNFTIKDLTIDANYSGNQASMQTANSEKFCGLNAIGIIGSYNTIENVRSINTYGSRANDREHFAISILTPAGTTSTGNTIRFCRAETPYGTYGNPFAIFGADNTHLMTDSSVEWCTATGVSSSTESPFNTGGVNCGWLKNCSISHNIFRDCSGAFYCDTGSLEKITIDHNKVDMGWGGIMLVAVAPSGYGLGTWTAKNIQITDNELTIQNRVVGGGSYGIKISSDSPSNLHISGNKQKHDATGGGFAQIWHFYLESVADSELEDNTSDDNGSGYNNAPSNFRSRNNKTWTGTTLSVSAGSGTFADNETDPNAAYVNVANIFSAYQEILSAQVRNSGDAYGQLTIADTTAYNASPRTGFVAAIKYNNAGALAGIGGITWSKENATDGNFAGALDISTRANGGSATSGLHMDSSQNISLPSLTAGNYVKTNGSKVLVSASTVPLADIASFGTGIATALGTNVGTAGAPVINGGALGTPSSGTLTNATGLPISGTTGYGTGIATFLATPSSANLASAVTDETGTGALVFGTAPAFTTSATVGLGATAAPTAFTVGDTSTSSPRGIMSWQSNTGTDGARLHLRKSRGTFASPTTVVSGDTLGRVVATGYDGTSFLEMGSINILSTGTIATTRVPTQMVFQTATDAAPSVLTTALTLGADQGATFAGTLATASHGITDASLSANVPLLNASNTFTAAQINSTAGAASAPALKLSGVPFAGTGTTSFPLLYLNDSNATASTTLSTAGTYLGVNGHGTADLFNFMTDGVTKLKLSNAGVLTTGSMTVGGNITLGTSNAISWGASRTDIFSSGLGLLRLTDSTNDNSFTRLQFGVTTNSGPAIGTDAVNGFTLQSAAGTATWNDSSTANSGTVANRYLFGIAAPTLTATGTSVTDTVASTVYIGGAPTASTNTTITTPYALNVAAGTSLFGGPVIHTDTTDSTTSTTGSLKTAGGLGVAKAVNVGTTVTIGGSAGAAPTTAGQVSYDSTNNNLSYGDGTANHRLSKWFYVSGSNYTNATTGLTDVTGLGFAVAANKAYAIEAHLAVNKNDTNGIQLQFTGPSAPTTVNIWEMFSAASGSANTANTLTAFSSGLTTFNTYSGDGRVFLSGVINNGANAGTVQLQVKSITGGTTTVYIGSWIQVTQLN